MTAELNATTACELFRGFRSLSEGRESIVFGLSGTVLKEVIGKHIALGIVVCINFYSLYFHSVQCLFLWERHGYRGTNYKILVSPRTSWRI